MTRLTASNHATPSHNRNNIGSTRYDWIMGTRLFTKPQLSRYFSSGAWEAGAGGGGGGGTSVGG